HFEISWQDSGDAAERLGPISFGYGSMHYIVSFKPGAAVGAEIPDEVCGLKAEVQVKTMLQHVWSALAHRLSFKGDLELSHSWQRELAGRAAHLENADDAIARIEEGQPLYVSGHRSDAEPTEITREIALLETVLQYDKQNAELANHIATLASSIGDWEK